MKSFSTFLLSILLIFFNTGTSFSEVSVYDNSNQYLGQLLSAQNLELYNNTNQKLFTIDLTTRDLFQRTLYFKTSNCSGQAYSTISPNGYLFKNGLSLYETGTDVETFSPASSLTNNQCTVASGPISWSYAKVAPYAGDLPFTRPIQTPLRYTTNTPAPQTRVSVIPLGSNN